MLNRFLAVLGFVVTTLASVPAHAQEVLTAGDSFAVTESYQTQDSDTDGSSGSSGGGSAWAVHILSIDREGTVFELDLPPSVNQTDRSRQWELPARILRMPDGTVRLLNQAEMTERLDVWLRRAGWTRERCGRWYFTWTAFQVSCDPTTVLQTFTAIFPSDPVAGDVFAHALASQNAPLAPCTDSRDGECLTATLPVDADRVRANLSEQDRVVREVIGPGQPELRNRDHDRITGTIVVRFVRTLPDGSWRRTETIVTETTTASGIVENSSRTVTLERRRMAVP